MTYPHTKLFINGGWTDANEGRTLPVVNPATGNEIGRVAYATQVDLEKALEATQLGFRVWSGMSPAERSNIMRLPQNSCVKEQL